MENATLRAVSTAVRVDFVLVELDLGVTFCERALSTQDEETKERNIRNARRAHDAALHFLPRLSLASAEQALIEDKASRLRGLFERLGLNAWCLIGSAFSCEKRHDVLVAFDKTI
jgi:hypothetical protein